MKPDDIIRLVTEDEEPTQAERELRALFREMREEIARLQRELEIMKAINKPTRTMPPWADPSWNEHPPSYLPGVWYSSGTQYERPDADMMRA